MRYGYGDSYVWNIPYVVTWLNRMLDEYRSLYTYANYAVDAWLSWQLIRYSAEEIWNDLTIKMFTFANGWMTLKISTQFKERKGFKWLSCFTFFIFYQLHEVLRSETILNFKFFSKFTFRFSFLFCILVVNELAT